MTYILFFSIFLFGLCAGSFLNVVICRLETGEGMVKKRSHCPRCGQTLAWYDLIPILSFFILRGQCRNCRGKISWQYPLVEIATGLLFVLTAIKLFPELVEGSKIVLDFSAGWLIRSNNIVSLFYGWFIIACLLVIFVYDLRHYIIPDKVLFPAIGAAFLYRIFVVLNLPTPLLKGGVVGLFPELVEGFKNFAPYLLAALVASAFFLFLVLITRGRGMGLGDVKLAFLMGLFLGWPPVAAAVFVAFFAGSIVGLALVIAGRKKMQSQIPFGPFLVAGALFIFFWGSKILDWYFNLLF